MHERQIRQRTTNRNDIEDICGDTSNQDRNAFYLKRNSTSDTSNGGSKRTGDPLLDRPFQNSSTGRKIQVITFDTLVSTLLTLPPTVRMDAMAATAISDAMRVYSIAVAPWAFFIRRRKIDSIDISRTSNWTARPRPAWELNRTRTALRRSLRNV